MITFTSLTCAIIASSSAALLLKFYPRIKRSSISNIADLKQKCESPIEEILFDELIRRDITPHPQYEISHYRLDFAISPKHLKINVGCDGRDYHNSWPQTEKDRKRNADLTKNGWAVLRFSGSQIYKDVNYCGKVIDQTIRTRQKQLNRANNKSA